jgi:hypothetical protein
MKRVILLILLMAAVALVLMAISPVTRRCRDRLEQFEAARRKLTPEPAPQLGPTPTLAVASESRPPEPPEREAVGYHVRQLLRPDGMLGVIFFVVLISFGLMNSFLLKENFEVLLNRPGAEFGTVMIGGLEFVMTDLHLYGFAISVALVLIGAACAACFEAKSEWRWAVLGGALAPLLVFEVALAAQRGFILASEGSAHPGISPVLLASFSALQAWVCATTEAIGGFFSVHRTLLPLMQAIGWMVVAPFRGIARRLAWARRPKPSRPLPEVDPLRPGRLTRIGAYLDEAIIGPLREVDRTFALLLAAVATAVSRKVMNHA